MSKLFSKTTVGPLALQNHLVMSPMTRSRAIENIPNELMAQYYGQRASSGGLIIAEATQISWQGKGYPQTPGIHTSNQVAGWREVVEAVHKKGGLIFLQLWHVGRISHSSHNPDGALPVSASAVRPAGEAFTAYPALIARFLGELEWTRRASAREVSFDRRAIPCSKVVGIGRRTTIRDPPPSRPPRRSIASGSPYTE